MCYDTLTHVPCSVLIAGVAVCCSVFKDTYGLGKRMFCYVPFSHEEHQAESRIVFVMSFPEAKCYILNTGWRRPMGCLILQGIFRKRATNYRALLRKKTYKDTVSYGSSPPCMPYTLKKFAAYGPGNALCSVL